MWADFRINCGVDLLQILGPKPLISAKNLQRLFFFKFVNELKMGNEKPQNKG